MMRRPPPPFLRAVLSSRVQLTPRLVRVTLRGDDIGNLEIHQPASSVRVLLPPPDRPDALELPRWDGNRFLLEDGSRPPIRTLTPRHHDRQQGALQFDVVVHGDGIAARWALHAEIGTPAAVSGPSRGYELDTDARRLVVGGDETAYAAMCSIVEAAPTGIPVHALLEVSSGSAHPPAPGHPRCRMEWVAPSPSGAGPGAALADRLGRLDLPPDARLWAAGEAGAMQRLRQTLFQERGLPRSRAVIRGYWKHGRSSGDDADVAG